MKKEDERLSWRKNYYDLIWSGVMSINAILIIIFPKTEKYKLKIVTNPEVDCIDHLQGHNFKF